MTSSYGSRRPQRFRLRNRILASLAALVLAAGAARGESAPTSLAAPTGGPLDGARAAALFARFRGLTGSWRERSTKGWTGGSTYRVIAAGSVVMATSSFDDDPGSTHGMATMVSLDGDRLLLTHYCEAGNQPRLVASELSADGDTVTFTFLDGGNLPSRDRGHMDKVVFRFVDADHFVDRWTWYENGKERWLEEIHNERVAAPPPAAR